MHEGKPVCPKFREIHAGRRYVCPECGKKVIFIERRTYLKFKKNIEIDWIPHEKADQEYCSIDEVDTYFGLFSGSYDRSFEIELGCSHEGVTSGRVDLLECILNILEDWLKEGIVISENKYLSEKTEGEGEGG